MKKLVFLLLMCCYQLSAEKIVDCKGFHHCKITDPINYFESDDLKFRSTAPKSTGKPIDADKEPGPIGHRLEVDDLRIFELTIGSGAEDQTIPASLFAAFPKVLRLFASEQNIRGFKPKTFVNAKLEVLRMNYHWIQKLEANTFEGLNNLEVLSMKGGALVEIDVAAFNGLDSLHELNLAENRINAVLPDTFQNLLELKTIDLGHNFISSLDEGTFSGLVNLEKINLENNLLEAVPKNLFKDNKYALEVFLGSNNLMKIPSKLFSHFTDLKTLDLQLNECIDKNYQNATEHFNEIEGDLSTSCNADPALNKQTIVAENSVSRNLEVKCTWEISTDTECSVFLRSEVVKVNDNVNIKLGRADYMTRDITENVAPEAIEKVTFLTDEVQAIPASIFTTFPNVKELRLVKENVRIIKPKTFINAQNLLELNLHYHRIKRLEANTFEGLAKVKTLILSRGSLSQIDVGAFNGLDNLKNLHLYNNKFKSISPEIFQNLPNLKLIYLAHNLIGQLDENTFSHLGNLKSLVLCDNDLETLPQALFGNNKNLSYINLSRNKLVHIPAKLFSHLEVEILKLSSNVCIDKSYRRKEKGSGIAAVIENDLAACNN
jgi:Leucine-rich repeat (LRR) protein